MSRALVVIPTYNEATNVRDLIPEVLKVDPSLDVLVVDDKSPDGTADVVKELMASESRLHIIQRNGKSGLGTAYVVGFKYAIENSFDYIFEMDADFSHDAREIPNFLARMRDYDLVVGSRYRNGVRVVNWPVRRLLLSYFANFYTRVITGLPVKDATGGFKCFRRKVLESIDLDSIRSNGYAFQIEVTYKAWRKGFSVHEIPIIFVDRRVGTSKMSKSIVFEAVFMVWKLRLQSFLGRL
jgi:dolichol-phosphate mannosyltransferase